jgi:hypothetical protein
LYVVPSLIIRLIVPHHDVSWRESRAPTGMVPLGRHFGTHWVVTATLLKNKSRGAKTLGRRRVRSEISEKFAGLDPRRTLPKNRIEEAN